MLERIQRALNTLLQRFGWAGLLILAGRAVTLGLLLIAARTSAGDDFGLFVVAMAATQILAIFCSLGTGPAAQQVVGEAIGRGRPARIVTFVRFAIRVTALVSIVLSAALVGIGFALLALLPGSAAGSACLATAVLTPVMAASSLREFTARALERVTLAFAPRDIGWSLLLSALLIGVQPARENLIATAAISLAFVEVLAWTATWQALRRATAGERPLRLRAYRRWMDRSLALMANFIGGFAFDRVDVLIVGLLTSLQTAGIYGAASRTASLLSVSQRFVVPVITPRVASRLAQGKHMEARAEARMGTLAVLPIVTPAAMAVFLFAPALMRLYGPQFVGGSEILRILAVGHIMVSLCSSYGVVVAMGPQPWLFARAIWMALIPAALVMLVVAPLLGPLAVAAVVAAGVSVYNFRLVRIAFRSTMARSFA